MTDVRSFIGGNRSGALAVDEFDTVDDVKTGRPRAMDNDDLKSTYAANEQRYYSTYLASFQARKAHMPYIEADRGADGKLKNGTHTTQAREHILAASIALSGDDKDEAQRRIQSAQIHASHSQHKDADKALECLDECSTLVSNDAFEPASKKLDEAYGHLQGEPNRLLAMKKREADPARKGKLIETLTFHPRFVEGSYNPQTRTADVIIVTEGMGNARDKHYYTADAIRDAVNSKVFEGEQAYADHPSKFDDANRPERSVRDLIGWYFDSKLTEVRDKKTGKIVPAYGAKFKIQEGADWAVGIVREAIEYNKKFPDKTYVGISINADGDTVPGEYDGIECNQVVKITEAFSADMVTKPARGGGFLKLVEGAGGANKIHKEHQAVKIKNIKDAAAQLDKFAEGESVDPTDLKAIATFLKESKDKSMKDDLEEGKGGKKADDGEQSTDDDADDMKEAKKSKEAEKVDTDGDNDVSDEEQTDTEDKSMLKPDKNKKKESAEVKAGTLLETMTIGELKKKHPSLYQAALAEAQAAAGGNDTMAALKEENAKLKAEKLLRESIALATRKLKESTLPSGAHKRVIQECVGLNESEMDEVIASYAEFTESLGVNTKRVGGNGERRIELRESDINANTSRLLEGVVEA